MSGNKDWEYILIRRNVENEIKLRYISKWFKVMRNEIYMEVGVEKIFRFICRLFYNIGWVELFLKRKREVEKNFFA